ncbi:hypothetical protein CRUP_018877, partial [Coryphaenoides rupestris]
MSRVAIGRDRRSGLMRSRGVLPHRVKPFKCGACGALFTTNGSLNRHMIVHVKSFKCPLCGEGFRTNLLCRKHMRKVHNVEERDNTGETALQYKCAATVSERVLSQSAAERDRISEIKDRAVELEAEPKFANCCGFCPKSFKKPSDLV